MADWVHCNHCFRQPGDGCKFSLTNCGHIYCHNCLDAGAKGICKLCGNACTTILLTSKMSPDVEKFFCDPADLVKRHHTELAQVMSFQKSHRQRLTSFNRQKLAKQTEMLQNAKKLMEQFKEIEKESQRLGEENVYLKKLIGSMGGNLPGRSPGHAGNRMYGGTVLSQRVHASGASPSSSMYSPYPSQKSKGSKSPYSQDTPRSSPQSLSQQGKRLSIRPPPTQGKIGIICRTPSPSQSGGHAARTPGSREASLPHCRPSSSPMKTSPSPYQRPSSTGKTPSVPIEGRKTPSASLPMFATPPVSSQNSLSLRLSASQHLNKKEI